MKLPAYVIAPSVLALMLGTVLFLGRPHRPKPVHVGHERAAYVRDKSHHCKVSGRYQARPSWDYTTESVQPQGGITYYQCDDNIVFHILDIEEQP